MTVESSPVKIHGGPVEEPATSHSQAALGGSDRTGSRRALWPVQGRGEALEDSETLQRPSGTCLEAGPVPFLAKDKQRVAAISLAGPLPSC